MSTTNKLINQNKIEKSIFNGTLRSIVKCQKLHMTFIVRKYYGAATIRNKQNCTMKFEMVEITQLHTSHGCIHINVLMC